MTSLYKSPLSSKHKAKIKAAVWQPVIWEPDREVLLSSSTYTHGFPITDAVQPVCWSSQLLTLLCAEPQSAVTVEAWGEPQQDRSLSHTVLPQADLSHCLSLRQTW